jgi:hypothetical protein
MGSPLSLHDPSTCLICRHLWNLVCCVCISDPWKAPYVKGWVHHYVLDFLPSLAFFFSSSSHLSKLGNSLVFEIYVEVEFAGKHSFKISFWQMSTWKFCDFRWICRKNKVSKSDLADANPRSESKDASNISLSPRRYKMFSTSMHICVHYEVYNTCQ